MAIKQVWLTTKGTKCVSEAQALDAEKRETIEDTINHYQHYDEYLIEDFLDFLQKDAAAVAFVEAINEVFAKNPHNGFKPAPNVKVT